jgi:hypothetical protein
MGLELAHGTTGGLQNGQSLERSGQTIERSGRTIERRSERLVLEHGTDSQKPRFGAWIAESLDSWNH